MIFLPNLLVFNLILKNEKDGICSARDVYKNLLSTKTTAKFAWQTSHNSAIKLLKEKPVIFRKYLFLMKQCGYIDFYENENKIFINKINAVIYKYLNEEKDIYDLSEFDDEYFGLLINLIKDENDVSDIRDMFSAIILRMMPVSEEENFEKTSSNIIRDGVDNLTSDYKGNTNFDLKECLVKIKNNKLSDEFNFPKLSKKYPYKIGSEDHWQEYERNVNVNEDRNKIYGVNIWDDETDGRLDYGYLDDLDDNDYSDYF